MQIGFTNVFHFQEIILYLGFIIVFVLGQGYLNVALRAHDVYSQCKMFNSYIIFAQF